MKLLKAFIRTTKVDEVIRALKQAGAPGITITRVNGVGYGYEPLLFTLAPSEIRKAPEVAKIEVVCQDDCVERLLEVILTSARTGYSGDGIVFITPVERAIKIRTGSEAPESLDPSNGIRERK
jgi:nitrogen regulatory protein P-II 1